MYAIDPKTLAAVQFAVWGFVLSKMIPFAGAFVMPMVWILSKKVFAGYAAIEISQMSFLYIRNSYMAETFFRVVNRDYVINGQVVHAIDWSKVGGIPWFFQNPITITAILIASIFVIFLPTMLSMTWASAWFLRRKIQKKNPLVWQSIQNQISTVNLKTACPANNGSLKTAMSSIERAITRAPSSRLAQSLRRIRSFSKIHANSIKDKQVG